MAPAQTAASSPTFRSETPDPVITPSAPSTATPATPAAPTVPATPAGAATQVAGAVASGSAASAQNSPGVPAQNQNAQSDDDLALDEAASFQGGGGQKSSPPRQRVTGSGRQQTRLDTLALTPAQRQAGRAVNGQRLSGGHLAAWNAATNARETADMAEVARLWSLGTPAAQQQARVLARGVFNRHVGRFWNAERRSAALRGDFTAAGMRFDQTRSGAPRYVLPSGEQTGMTLDHNTRLSDNPTMALNGNNLSFVLDDENSVTLEYIRNNDPHQR